jgi:hypothetical protein
MEDEPTAAERFKDFLRRLARVPKREIDEQERRDTRNRERRKTPKPAKHGRIVPTIEPR